MDDFSARLRWLLWVLALAAGGISLALLIPQFPKYQSFMAVPFIANYSLQCSTYWPGRFWVRLTIGSILVGSGAILGGAPIQFVALVGLLTPLGHLIRERSRRRKQMRSVNQ
jgi:hypothetical protein